MKSNLDSQFKTDASLEKEGIWFKVGVEGNTRFRFRRWGGSNTQRVKQAMAKYHKPKARLIELGQLSPEESHKIMVQVFVEACLVTWEGVEIDGVEVEYDPAKAVSLFVGLPELFDTLHGYSMGFESFKEDLGNF